VSIADETIYLDHAATTPLDPGVLAAMIPYLETRYGNPSSIYQIGQDAKAGLERARGQVARALGCRVGEVVFTGGATESDNLALAGPLWAARFADPAGPPPHLVTTAIEHHAVLHAADWLREIGFGVTVVPVGAAGIVEPAVIAAAMRPETRLVSVMYANNEIGAVQPVAEIAAIAHAGGALMHTDAVQAPGMLPLNVEALGVDLLSLSAHKFYGPKGVGALYVRTGTRMRWQAHGGGQEGGRRAGTENVAGIVGLGAALERIDRGRDAYATHCRTMRDALWAGLAEEIPGVALNGPELDARRLPNNLNVAVAGVQGETALLALDMLGIAASAGSACTTGRAEPSHVLLAIGHDEARARTSLRLTVGQGTTLAQIDETVEALAEAVARIRAVGGQSAG
jgi:cysteine desulfurase